MNLFAVEIVNEKSDEENCEDDREEIEHDGSEFDILASQLLRVIRTNRHHKQDDRKERRENTDDCETFLICGI